MTWKLHIQYSRIISIVFVYFHSWEHTSIENPALDKQNVPYDLLSEDILKKENIECFIFHVDKEMRDML